MYIPCIFIICYLFVPIYVHLMVQVNNVSVATQKRLLAMLVSVEEQVKSAGARLEEN